MEEKEFNTTLAIPANYTDSGKIFGGMLEPRNAVEALILILAIAEPLASVLYSRMKRLYHTEVWYGRFLLYPLEGGESDVLIAVIIIVTTNHYFIHSMPSWHVAYIAENRTVKRYRFSLLWWHAPRRHENGPQTRNIPNGMSCGQSLRDGLRQ